MLLDDIKRANMQALKNHDELVHQVLPLVMAKAIEKTVALRSEGKTLTDEDVIACIRKLSAEYDESIVDFKAAGRDETVAILEKKKEILASYLPRLMSEDEIRKEIALLPDRSLGAVMAHFKKELSGKADLAQVARIAREGQ